jgi:putative methionine-R-sulfoxide reductase with GAF domain
MGPLVLFGFYLVWRSPTWDQFVILGIFVGLSLAGVVNVWLNRRGRPEAGMLFYLWSNLIAYPAVVLAVSDVGLLLAVVCVLLTSVIASVTVSRIHSTRLLFGSLAVGVGVLLADFYLPMPWRTPVPRPEIMYAFVVVMAIVYFAFMAGQLRTFTLRGKLLLAFIGLSLVSVVTVAAVSGWLSWQALLETSNSTLQAAAAQTAARVDEFLQANTAAVWAEAQMPALGAYLRAAAAGGASVVQESEAASVLGTFALKHMALTSSYALFDTQGIARMDTYAPSVGARQANRDYFRIPLETGRPYASPVEFSETTDKPFLNFSAPVHDQTGATVGVLRLQIDAAALQDLIASAYGSAGRNTFAVLLDENHIRLADGLAPADIYKSVVPLDPERVAALQAARRLPPSPLEELSTQLPAFERGLALAAQQPIFATPLAGLEGSAAGAIQRLGHQSWYVVMFQPQAVLQASAREQQRALILLALVIAALAAGAAVMFAQLLTAPIARLSGVAARIAAGDLTARARVDSADEIGALAGNFNTMTAQLRDVIGTLEQRVAERTKAVQTSAEVSRRLSTITNPQQLILAVVDEIKQAFGYYHAHIYLFDDARQHLAMAGGTGEAGRILLSRGHKIPRGRGLVGRAAETRSVVLVPDTYADPGWLPNDLLPETKSEVAGPIVIGERVLGVLDVQHNVVNGLKPSDAQLLEAIGRQVAVALQNARAYAQTQQAARRETLINRIGQKIQGAATMEEALQIAAAELATALQASRASAQLDAPVQPMEAASGVRPAKSNGGSV